MPFMNAIKRITAMAVLTMLLVMVSAVGRAEIMNDDEFGSLELVDISVIEQASDIFLPTGITFNVQRGGSYYPGDEIVIRYHGQHGRYATLLDYSSNRIVKPLVMNELTELGSYGLERKYIGVVGDVLGDEYIMLIISALPITDERLEAIAEAPHEVEYDDLILSVAVSNFKVVEPIRQSTIAGRSQGTTGRPVNVRPDTRDDMFIELDQVAIDVDYPLNTYPYNPWPYMYLHPYPVFRPTQYVEQYGPFSRQWYVFPQWDSLSSNFFDYAWAGWLDDGRWVIPPGGYWQGTLRIDDPYSSYYLRVLPYLARENTSYGRLQVEINGNLVQPNFDITGAIGYGQYWTSNPFSYYTVDNLLRQGENTLRLYWPRDEEENLELQMLDVVPAEVAEEEIESTGEETSGQQENSSDAE